MAENKVVLDIDEMAADMGVAYEEDIGPDGSPRRQYIWSVEDMLRGVERARPLAEEGRPIEFIGGAAHWVLAAMTAATYPYLSCYTVKAVGATAEIFKLPMGEVAPEGGIRFEVRDEGDRLIVDYESDDPNSPPLYGPHNYDRSLLPKVVVPAIRPDQHLYIHGVGEYSIVMTIVNAYAGKCRSINVKGKTEDYYVCAATYCGEKKLGEITRL